MEFNFNHEENDILKALGTNVEQIEILFDKINETANACNATSEVVEKLGENFTSQELAFVITDMKTQIERLTQMEMLADMLDISPNGEGDSRVIPLGEKGEA